MKATEKEITQMLLDRLWDRYLKRVPYAKKYVELVIEKGGRIVNDHIAFRTLNTHTGEQPGGITAISHIFRALGYRKADSYKFHKLKLTASHFEHSDPMYPKIFVSQLELSEFPEWVQNLVRELVTDTPYLISDQGIELLNLLKIQESLPIEAAEVLIGELVNYFSRAWGSPKKETILKVNDISQYCAWTLLHGNSVNHFTAFINYHGVEEWPDLEATCNGLLMAGIPLKNEIEGEKGGKLRQSATQAVKEEMEVIDEEGNIEYLQWTYAYYELAERGYIEENGEKKMFNGFLGDQAVHLFDMTRTRDN